MKNRVIQIALSAAMLLLLVQVVLIAPGQIRDSENKASIMPAPDLRTGQGKNDVDQSMNGMHMIETQEGGKEWELWADKAVSLKTKEMMELETVKTVFFSKNGAFTVTGKRGEVQTKTKNLKIEGDVVTRSSNGYVFRTQSMEYDPNTRLLSAANEVEMNGPRDHMGHSLKLTGVGMQASLEEGTMDVLHDVHASKGLDGGRKVLIRSQHSLFNSKDKSAQFGGDVVLDMDSTRITGPDARFDYDPQTDAVKTITFTGGARVSDSEKFATSQNLRVDLADNRFVFRGHPRVVQNNDELRGEEIVFIDGGKQVQVRRARAKVDEKHVDGIKQESAN
jgi:LPS export ABC transporter protein LptC